MENFRKQKLSVHDVNVPLYYYKSVFNITKYYYEGQPNSNPNTATYYYFGISE